MGKIRIADIPTVGGKNASLEEMIQQLKPKGVKVPTRFATTAEAYRYFMQAAAIEPQLISCPVKDLSLRQQGSRGQGERGFSGFCTDAGIITN